MSDPALQTLQVRQTAQDLLVGHSDEADRKKFVFWRLLAAFLLYEHTLPVASFGDQRNAYRGGRAAGGAGEEGGGFSLTHIDVDSSPELMNVAVSREKALKATSLGANKNTRLNKYRALRLGSGARAMMVYFEQQLLTFLTTLANWHPTASKTVAEADRWSDATADVYQQIYDIIESTGADCLVMDPGSWKKASAHPKITAKLGDNAPKNLSEEEFVSIFSRVLPSLKEIVVMRAVGDPDDEVDYLADGTNYPHFCIALKAEAGSAGRTIEDAMNNGAVPTLDVAAVACVDEIEDFGAEMSRVPLDAMMAMAILPPTSVGPTILKEDWRIWSGLSFKALKAKRGALLRATYV